MAYRSNDDITWKHQGKEMLLVNLANGAYFKLDAPSAIIWSGLMDGQSNAEIVEVIKDTFNTQGADVAGDVKCQIGAMLKEKIIREV